MVQPPLIDLLGAAWQLGAAVVGVAWVAPWDAEQPLAAFGLGDGGVALARGRWDGGPEVGRRPDGGVEVTLARAPRPPVSRVQAHKPRAGAAGGGCLALVSDPAGGFLSGGADGTLVRLSAEGEARPRTEFGGRPVAFVAAAGAGRFAFASGRDVRTTTGQALSLPGAVRALAYDVSGEHLAVAHAEGVSVLAGRDAPARHLRTPGPALALAWSPDGAYVAAGLDTGGERGAILAWHMPDGADTALAGCAGPPHRLAFSADGAFLAASGGPRALCWGFNPPSPAEPLGCGLSSRQHPVSAVAWHPALPVLAAGYSQGAAVLCQPGAEGALMVKGAGGGAVTALAFSPDGRLLALGTAEGEAGIVLFPDGLLRQPGECPSGTGAVATQEGRS